MVGGTERGVSEEDLGQIAVALVGMEILLEVEEKETISLADLLRKEGEINRRDSRLGGMKADRKVDLELLQIWEVRGASSVGRWLPCDEQQ